MKHAIDDDDLDRALIEAEHDAMATLCAVVLLVAGAVGAVVGLVALLT